jgi:hypothetical protein
MVVLGPLKDNTSNRFSVLFPPSYNRKEESQFSHKYRQNIDQVQTHSFYGIEK